MTIFIANNTQINSLIMPELPEVETVKCGIQSHLLKQKITKVVIRNSQLRQKIPPIFKKQLINKKIVAVKRRAKYLLIEFANGHHLICHLGMSGQLFIVTDNKAAKKHDHVDIILENGNILRYCDPRRFGLMLYEQESICQNQWLKKLGPEPLSNKFNARNLFKSIAQRSISIKNAIMMQAIVVGVGNIYASEALFTAGIHPNIPCRQLTLQDCQRLVSAIKKTLRKAIRAGGTTLKDFINPDGKTGYFQHQLLVYGRTGQQCQICKTIIAAKVIGGRNSFYCATCQPLSNDDT